MKKVQSLFFYLLVVSTLNNINYIFPSPDNAEKPEWFQKLEELKNSEWTANHKKWRKMFNTLPQDLQKRIKDKLYEPLQGIKIRKFNSTGCSAKTPALKVPGHLLDLALKGVMIPIPNPLDFLWQLFFSPKNQYTTEEQNPTFASLSMQVSESSDKFLRTNLKVGWINLLKTISNTSDFESKAMRIMFQELGRIVYLEYYPGYHATQCVEATVFSDDSI